MKSVRFSWFSFALLAACIGAAQTNPVPFVGQPLVPAAAAPGSAGFTLTVNGAGFVSGSTVNWNGTPLPTTFVSAAKLKATVPAADVAAQGTARVTVVNPTPGGGSSDPALFEITNPASSLVFRTSSLSGVTSPLSAVTADFNHDGIADLAVIDQAPAPACNYQFHGTGSIVTYLGNGDGTFTKKSALCYLDFFGSVPESLMLAGDLNMDGKVDLIATSSVAGDALIGAYYGNGDGTFSGPTELYPSSTITTFALRAAASAVFENVKGLALADFYGSGQKGLAVSLVDSTGQAQIFLLPDRNGLFGQPASVRVGAATAGDFNGDGKLDLADDSGTLKIFLNNGNKTFTKMPDISFGSPGSSIANGDFNGDGIPDLATVLGNSIAVMLGNGDSTFTAKTGQPTAAQTNSALITADVNGDGKLDLVVVDSTNVVSVWLGNGDGTFQAPIDTTGRGDSVIAADFNDDGKMDLAVTDSAAGTVSILLQGSPYRALVESPINADGSSVFSAHRGVLPVNFTLTENGVPTCTMPDATIAVTRTAGAGIGPVSDATYKTRWDRGTNFRIDRSTCQYVYHLDARAMGAGTYRVDISIKGTVVGDAVFTLRKHH